MTITRAMLRQIRMATAATSAVSLLVTPACARPTKDTSISVPPVTEGWQRGKYKFAYGAIDFKRGSPFVEDVRPLEPKKALQACRDGNLFACSLFNYPSAEQMAEAQEAKSIYESIMETASSPAGRIALAFMKGGDPDWEIRKVATPEVLNAFIKSGDRDITVAELWADRRNDSPEGVQWLYDHGARLCELDGPSLENRYTCYQIYSKANQSVVVTSDGRPANEPFIQVLDVMERNGFHANSKAELHAIINFRMTLGRKSQTELRYFALPGSKDQATIARAIEAEEKKWAAVNADREDQELLGLLRETDRSGRADFAVVSAAGARLQRGQLLCRRVMVNSVPFVLRANLEDRVGNRLQLRTASLRGRHAVADGMQYRDARISPGSIFWDNIDGWMSGC